MTSYRIFNFSSGPAVLPVPVLERAAEEILSYGNAGMGVMEMSHRSIEFGEILSGAEERLRRLLSVPENYRVLFLQGGATLQFTQIPMAFLQKGRPPEYVITGTWGEKAYAAARHFGEARVAFTSADDGFTAIPAQEELSFAPDASYIHYTSNETIDGVEFKYDLDGGAVPVVCDACSNILSKPIDVEKYSLIYAGAQKNIGPSGVTVVIVRDEMLANLPEGLPPIFDYRTLAANRSMVNTPNTWGIYMIGLVCGWIEDDGGLTAMEKRNNVKAARLYSAIDNSDGFYSGRASVDARSSMNVTFQLPNAELDQRFCIEAKAAGLNGLAGHRTVGGIRASIYNAFPMEGVDRLVEFMSEFSSANG